MTDGIKSFENPLDVEERSPSMDESDMSRQKSPEGNTTNSMEGEDSRGQQISAHEHGGKPHRTSTRNPGKTGKVQNKKKKILSKLQVKKMARKEGEINNKLEGEEQNKYMAGEVSSRRTSATLEKRLMELMDEEFVSTEEETEDTKNKDQEAENREEQHPFWTPPPR